MVATLVSCSRYVYGRRLRGRWLAVHLLVPLLVLVAASVSAQTPVDYDGNDDGLIEVSTLAQLNALRWDLDGDGAADATANDSDYAAAFPNAASGMGCPSTCSGYELTADLDFDTNGDGRTDQAGDNYWNDGSGWEPIGDSTDQFSSTFHGNGHSILNLFIDRIGNNGFFGYLNWAGVVRELQLLNVDVNGSIMSASTGGLVAQSEGTIIGVFVDGEVNAYDAFHNAGLLVGANYGLVAASYVNGAVGGSAQNVGGLAGQNSGGWAEIITSYVVATVSITSNSPKKAGLATNSWGGTVINSYWDTDVSGITTGAGVGKTTAELQNPTNFCGIYADWDNLYVGGTADDEPLWLFGTSSDYPLLYFQGDPDTAPDFCDAFIRDEVWEVDRPLGRTLPKAAGGNGKLTYSLTGDLPRGVRFHADAQHQLGGTPSEVQEATTYTYTATDEDGDTASLTFTITVKEPPEVPLPSQREIPEPQVIPNRWIVGVAGTCSTWKAQGIANRNNATLHQELRWVGMIILTTNFTTQAEADQFLADIVSDSDVTFAEADARVRAIPFAQPTPKPGGGVGSGTQSPPKKDDGGVGSPPGIEIGESVVFGTQLPPKGGGGVMSGESSSE